MNNILPQIVRKNILALAISIISIIIIADILLNRLSLFTIGNYNIQDDYLNAFLILGTIYCIVNLFILKTIRRKIANILIKSKGINYPKFLGNLIIVIQCILIILFLLVIYQIFFIGYYYSNFIYILVIISYSLNSSIMGIISFIFFSISNINKNHIVISYALASTVFTIGSLLTLSFVIFGSIEKPLEIREFAENVPMYIHKGTFLVDLNNLRNIFSISSFIMMWISTVLLMHSHSKRTGKVIYWSGISIPLVFFLSQYPSYFLNLFDSYLRTDPVSYAMLITIIFTFSRPVGGLLFGIAFWLIALKIHNQKNVQDYLMLSGFGFALLFLSDQGSLLIKPSFPPFGIIAVSLFGLSSYLIFTGLYSSSISISHDTELRKLIKSKTIDESNLLWNLSSAMIIQHIENKIVNITEKKQQELAMETGIHSSLTQKEIKEYIVEVLREIKSPSSVDETSDSRST